MRCWVCGTTEEQNFAKREHRFICDDCMLVIDYHVEKAFKELQELNGTPENEFLEALEQYVSYKQDEYNENLRKERMNQWQK